MSIACRDLETSCEVQFVMSVEAQADGEEKFVGWSSWLVELSDVWHWKGQWRPSGKDWLEI